MLVNSSPPGEQCAERKGACHKAEPYERGRPSAEDQKEVVGHHLQGTVEVNATAVVNAKRTLGRFIIATNELDASRLTAAGTLENYTDQGVSIERGFRFLKDPLFFAKSLF